MPIERVSNLEFDRWAPLADAISQLIQNRTYEGLVTIHSEGGHRTHNQSGPVGTKRFLPWHRAYLIIFERHLREIDSDLSIPYWDWNADGGELFGFPDPADARFSQGRWSRSPGTRQSEGAVEGRESWFTTPSEIRGLLSTSTGYFQFTQDLENGPHGNGHNWIGGDMRTMNSPRDPAFWFHHAQVDRIWYLWQQRYPNEIAELSGRDAELDPWDEMFDIHSVNDISNLGSDSYIYVEPRDVTA